MSKIVIAKRKMTVNMVEVPNINGGFGRDKKAMLAMHIAEIHNKKLKSVNEAINNNRDKFRDGVDIIDIKNSVDAIDPLLESDVITRQSASNSTNIYMLSERGYAKLIKIFSDDKSWELYDIMLDEYFDLRDSDSNKGNAPISMEDIIIHQMEQAKLQKQKLKQIESDISQNKQESQRQYSHLENKFNREIAEEGHVSSNYIARELDIFSTSDRPHGQFIGAVAKQLKIYNNQIGYQDDYIKVIRATGAGGVVKGETYFSEKGYKLVKEFIVDKFKPYVMLYKRGEKKGKFNKAQFQLLGKNYGFNEKTSEKYK